MLCSIPYFGKTRIVGRCTRIPPWIYLDTTFTLPEYHMNTTFLHFRTEENCDKIIMSIKDVRIATDEERSFSFSLILIRAHFYPSLWDVVRPAEPEGIRHGRGLPPLRYGERRCPPNVHLLSTGRPPIVYRLSIFKNGTG